MAECPRSERRRAKQRFPQTMFTNGILWAAIVVVVSYLRIGAPNLFIPSHGIRAVENAGAFGDEGAIGERVVLDGELDVNGDTGVEAQDLHGDGMGVSEVSNVLVRVLGVGEGARAGGGGVASVADLFYLLNDLDANVGILGELVESPRKGAGGGIATSNHEVHDNIAQLVVSRGVSVNGVLGVQEAGEQVRAHGRVVAV